MKKILSLALALLLTLSLCACNSSGDTEKAGGLQIGFGRVDITPNYEVCLQGGDYKSRVAKSAKDYVYVTCVAIRNGEETVLLYTMDLKVVTDNFADPAKAAISSATGVPQANILLNATHTHSSVAIRYNWDGADRYRMEFNQYAVSAAEKAIADLSAANVYAGGTQTEKLTFVRHYNTKDGGVAGANFGNHGSGYEGHTREADQELQLVRFEREGKKDVLLMSFPSHATFFESGKEISADFPGYARNHVEKNADVLVAVFQGASGDQVPTSRIGEENYTKDCRTHGEKLGQYALDALSGLKKIENSDVKLSTKTFVGNSNKDGVERAVEAQAVVDVVNKYGASSAEVKAAVSQYGFASRIEASWIVTRARYGPTQSMDLRVLSIGELGFVIAPYEMFGMHGKQIKEKSPFETTMIITCSEGAKQYLPNAESYDYGAYESYVAMFEKGTAETLVTEFVDMLTQLKGK